MTLEQQRNQIISDIISQRITESQGVEKLIAIGMPEVRAIASAHLAITGSDIKIRPNPPKN
jgi:hypothetical protein